MSNEALRRISSEIMVMSEADQRMRKRVMSKEGGWDATFDQLHTLRMKQIVAEIGWPTISKVGPVASKMAWLLVQHADHDREFQQACLDLMKAQPTDEVAAQNIAYLEDRVRVGGGRPQLYGTQFRSNEQGEPEPLPIEDPEHVDQRRADVGLSSLAEYTDVMKAHRKVQ